jgi:hypothetical protein
MPIGKRAAMQAAEATDRICCVIEHLMQRKLHAKFNEEIGFTRHNLSFKSGRSGSKI